MGERRRAAAAGPAPPWPTAAAAESRRDDAMGGGSSRAPAAGCARGEAAAVELPKKDEALLRTASRAATFLPRARRRRAAPLPAGRRRSRAARRGDGAPAASCDARRKVIGECRRGGRRCRARLEDVHALAPRSRSPAPPPLWQWAAREPVEEARHPRGGVVVDGSLRAAAIEVDCWSSAATARPSASGRHARRFGEQREGNAGGLRVARRRRTEKAWLSRVGARLAAPRRSA